MNAIESLKKFFCNIHKMGTIYVPPIDSGVLKGTSLPHD